MATVKAPPPPEAVAAVGGLTRRCGWVLRTRRPADHISFAPFQVTSRRSILRWQPSGPYEWVVLEGDCMAGVLGNPGLRAEHVAWRVNNQESSYLWQLSLAARGPASGYLLLEAAKFAWWTARLRRQSSWHVWFASKVEHRAFAESGQERAARSRWLPPPMPLERAAPPHRGPGGALFVGSLFMPNNRAGLRWYLTHVHPRIGVPGYTLTIAGQVRGAEIRDLRRLTAGDRQVRWVESPDDQELALQYRLARVFVNPMRRGGGIALKTPHALLAGLPVVSTSVGVRGSGLEAGEHVDVADVPAEFAARVSRQWTDPHPGLAQVERAQIFIRGAFDHERLLGEALGGGGLAAGTGRLGPGAPPGASASLPG